MKPSKKHAAAVYEITRKADPTVGGPTIQVPTRYNSYRSDPMENYIKEHAVTYTIHENLAPEQVLIMFQDNEGQNINGYYLRPDQVEYVIQRIIG